MALPSSNVNTTNVSSELGISPLRKLSELVGYSNLNKFSFYSPGFLSVDASSNTVLTPPSNHFKIGDYRSYNHSAAVPSGPNDFTVNWGPGGILAQFVMTSFCQNMSVWEYAAPGDYITHKYYLSSANRDSETDPIATDSSALLVNTITPLTGHTRTTNQQSDNLQIHASSFPSDGLTTPNDIVYAESYISNLSGDRKINLGDVRSDGYTTINTHEFQDPHVDAIGNISPVPSGYTTAFGELYTASSPVCSNVATVDQNFGGTTWNFYFHVRGIFGASQRIVAVQDCSVMLTIDGSTQRIYQGSLSHSASTSMSGTLIINNGQWNYDDVGQVTIVNHNFVTTPAFTSC